jgi:hypothetical protein
VLLKATRAPLERAPALSMRQVDLTTLFPRAEERDARLPGDRARTISPERIRRDFSGAIVTVPKRCDFAMLGLAALSFCSALSLSYYCLTGLDKTASHPTGLDTAVYDARAVPRDEDQPRRGRRGASDSSNLEQSKKLRGDDRYGSSQPRRTAAVPSGDAARQMFSFPELDWNLRAQSFGLASSIVGPTSQSNSAGQIAPDAEFDAVVPVPETRLWSVTGAATALLILLERLRPARRQD